MAPCNEKLLFGPGPLHLSNLSHLLHNSTQAVNRPCVSGGSASHSFTNHQSHGLARGLARTRLHCFCVQTASPISRISKRVSGDATAHALILCFCVCLGPLAPRVASYFLNTYY
eukprot:g7782.t1